MLQTI
ncbi:hypothetical protein LINPERPRIM_LOCUS28823 [Linum perenne]